MMEVYIGQEVRYQALPPAYPHDMARHTFFALAISVASAAVFSGCAVSQRADDPEPDSLGVVSERSDALAAREAHPEVWEGDSSAVFRIVSGVDAPGMIQQVSRDCTPNETSKGSQDPVCVEWRLQSDGTVRSVRRLERTEDGAILLRSISNEDRGMITEFNPPLMEFPAELQPGSPTTHRVAMRVVSAKSKRERERGEGSIEITLEGNQQIKVNGRSLNAVKVRIVFHADLKAAAIVRTTDRWYVPGTGVVRERYEETVKILGVTSEETGQELMRE